MKKHIITEQEKNRILKLHLSEKNINEDLTSYYGGDEFKKMLDKMSEPSPMFDYTSETSLSPKKFNEFYDKIEGKLFASFGGLGKYVEFIRDYPASPEMNLILKKHPVIDTFSSYDDYKNSPYYEMSEIFFKPNRYHTENDKRRSFDHFIDKFGDLIIKKGGDFNKENFKTYRDKTEKMSPEDKTREYTVGINKVHQNFDDEGNVISRKNIN